MHTDAYTLVKWQGEMSEHIQMRQGIRQGAKLSTLMYKRFNNDLLDTLQSAPEGVKIGTLDVSSPTCADDIALLKNKQTDAQILTNIIDHASSMDRFTIHVNPLKSEILVFKTSKRTPQNIEVVYKQNTITQVTSLKHLGIERNQSNAPDIAKRIETARKTLYALLGSGMHGISPAIIYQMWITFVIPRLLHGIELLDIRKTDVEKTINLSEKSPKAVANSPSKYSFSCRSLPFRSKRNRSAYRRKDHYYFLEYCKRSNLRGTPACPTPANYKDRKKCQLVYNSQPKILWLNMTSQTLYFYFQTLEMIKTINIGKTRQKEYR